jgi:transposase InsO family protein
MSPLASRAFGGFSRSSSSTAFPSSQRYKRHDRTWKRYQRQLPGHQIQIDVKFVDTLQGSGRGKKFYQFTAIDDCTRLRVLRLYPNCDMRTAIRFYDYTASRMPFTIERVQTDNGSEFQSAFHLHLLDQGVDHHYIRPRTLKAQCPKWNEATA